MNPVTESPRASGQGAAYEGLHVRPMHHNKTKRETARARQAYHDYVALGINRTLAGLLELYERRVANSNGTYQAPAKYLSTLKAWSWSHDWQKRVILLVERENQAGIDQKVPGKREEP